MANQLGHKGHDDYREVLIYLEFNYEFIYQCKTLDTHWQMKKHSPGPQTSLQSGGDDGGPYALHRPQCGGYQWGRGGGGR